MKHCKFQFSLYTDCFIFAFRSFRIALAVRGKSPSVFYYARLTDFEEKIEGL